MVSLVFAYVDKWWSKCKANMSKWDWILSSTCTPPLSRSVYSATAFQRSILQRLTLRETMHFTPAVTKILGLLCSKQLVFTCIRSPSLLSHPTQTSSFYSTFGHSFSFSFSFSVPSLFTFPLSLQWCPFIYSVNVLSAARPPDKQQSVWALILGVPLPYPCPCMSYSISLGFSCPHSLSLVTAMLVVKLLEVHLFLLWSCLWARAVHPDPFLLGPEHAENKKGNYSFRELTLWVLGIGGEHKQKASTWKAQDTAGQRNIGSHFLQEC